jgi:hypothetical protein
MLFRPKTDSFIAMSFFVNPLSRDSGNFLFHFVLFPATQFLSFEQLSVIAAVSRVPASKCDFVNLFPYPSLSFFNWRSAIGAFVRGDDHCYLPLNHERNPAGTFQERRNRVAGFFLKDS